MNSDVGVDAAKEVGISVVCTWLEVQIAPCAFAAEANAEKAVGVGAPDGRGLQFSS